MKRRFVKPEISGYSMQAAWGQDQLLGLCTLGSAPQAGGGSCVTGLDPTTNYEQCAAGIAPTEGICAVGNRVSLVPILCDAGGTPV